jgi:hypothetical protein
MAFHSYLVISIRVTAARRMTYTWCYETNASYDEGIEELVFVSIDTHEYFSNYIPWIYTSDEPLEFPIDHR